MATMTDKEKKDFETLYQYVKKILGYGDDMALSKFMVLRLKGLSEGKFHANKKVKATASYDYNTIYLTFVYCKADIQRALQTKTFQSEQNKFNYIMAIVENNINDVVMRLKNAKKSKEVAKKQIDKIEINTLPTTNHSNKPSNDATNKKNIKFTDLTKEMW